MIYHNINYLENGKYFSTIVSNIRIKGKRGEPKKNSPVSCGPKYILVAPLPLVNAALQLGAQDL